MKGWKPRTEADEAGFGRGLLGSLEDAVVLMEDISIEAITKNLPRAARAVEFESTGGRNKLVKKTKEQLEVEKFARENWRRTEDGHKGSDQTKKEIQSLQGMQKVKNKQATSQALYCEKEGENTSDRQKWKEELERYSRNKYQDEEMRMKARKELDEWDERSRKQRRRAGGSQEPRLPMSVIMQSRASFSNGKAVGMDGISAEILKSIPGRALRKRKKEFEMRYIGQNKEDIETWLRNIIVLIPKIKTIDRFEGQTRGICVQSVLAKWYCGCLTILLEMELRNVEKRDKRWGDIHTFVFEDGRSATEISTSIRLVAAAARGMGT